MSVLIKGGRIVTASDDYHADIFINRSSVTLIGKDLVIDADETIDAAGKLVIPGGVDHQILSCRTFVGLRVPITL